MKVGEIIDLCTPEWMPGALNDRPVEVSILLPTFRRGQDGLFLRVARSILNQSFENLELIVVDDASTDGTSQLIDKLMRQDGRVSCIRHRQNIGLPAISEYEAYKKARGNFIGFAFDDFLFEQDSVGQLLNLMQLRQVKAIHGTGKMLAGGHDFTLGDSSAAHDQLFSHNFIANASVMLNRCVIEEVGLYDPHIVMSRLCDWDLWRRVRRRTVFDRADVLVGREHGASRPDSLGNTYPVQFEVVYEFMGEDRDVILQPQNFENRDVLSCPSDASYLLRCNISTQMEFFSNKYWFPKHQARLNGDRELNSPVKSRKTAAVVAASTASFSLCWIGEPGSEFDYVSLIDSGSDNRTSDPLILKSDIVIFVREIMEPNQQRMLDLCRRAKVPHLYFIDDNLPLLARTELDFVHYRIGDLKRQLSSFSGVLATSKALADSLGKVNLHPQIEVVRPIFLPSQLVKMKEIKTPRLSTTELTVACFGGSFRSQGLVQKVLPALNQLQSDTVLVTRELNLPTPLLTGKVEHRIANESTSFFRFLKDWRRMKPDIIAHPAGLTANIDYKTENAIIVAAYLGAVPVVTDEVAYRDLSEGDGVVKVEDTVQGWHSAFERLGSVIYRKEMMARLEQTCAERFSGSDQIRILNRYLSAQPELDAVSYESRFRLALSRTNSALGSLTGTDSSLSILRGLPLVGDTYASGGLPIERGYVDGLEGGNLVWGWAYAGSNGPVDLVLEVDDFIVGRFIADHYRGDLLEAGIGDGHHGFRVKIPGLYLDNLAHRVSIKFYDTGHALDQGDINWRLSR